MRKQRVPDYLKADCANRSVRKLAPQFVVLHHTGACGMGNLTWLQGKTSRVSCDFLVMRSGLVYKLNPQLSEWYTWHSGESRVGKVQDVNPRSFGVELEHAPGQDWPEKQLSACLGVVAYLVWRFDMKFSGVMGHADVAWPRGRKMDPEGFPWAAFRADLAVRLEV